MPTIRPKCRIAARKNGKMRRTLVAGLRPVKLANNTQLSVSPAGRLLIDHSVYSK